MQGFDFAMTNEGDLQLGTEKINDQGEILYRQADGSISTVYQEGSTSVQDMAILRGKQALKQNIYNRLRTDNPDWYHHLNIGANLTDLIGEHNTKETADRGAAYISAALTYKGLLQHGQFSIRTIPISANEIMFLLTVTIEDEEEFRLPLVFNLHRGLKEVDIYEEE